MNRRLEHPGRSRTTTTATRGRRRGARYQPRLDRLEERQVLSALVVGAAPGQPPVVQVRDADGTVLKQFDAFPRSFRGGVEVATGDVNGDDVADIIAATATGAGTVRVFDGQTYARLASFRPYGASYSGGVNVAFGQLTTSGGGEIITGTSSGAALVKVFDGANQSLLRTLRPYAAGTNGVQVAAANADGDFVSEIFTAPGAGARPVIRAYDGDSFTQVAAFDAYDRAYRGGVRIATGDFNDDRIADVVTGRARGDSTLKVWSQGRLISEFDSPTTPAASFTGLRLGAVATPGAGADLIAVAWAEPRRRSSSIATAATPGRGSESIDLYELDGDRVGSHLIAGLGSSLLDIASAEAPVFTTYAGARQYGVSYSPTWPNWAPTANTQLFDSDFANDAFKGLWDVDATGQGRRDLTSIQQNAGFNLVRLYDWSPTRGASTGNSAHISFLDKAQQLGLRVMVPISDYFLGDAEFSWNGAQITNYDRSSAPAAIQTALNDFVQSITKNGKIHPAVHSLSVGNELDLGIANDPGNTVKLQRALWWVVNLQQLVSQPSGLNPDIPHPLLTIPISNGDQGAWIGGISTGNNTATTIQETVTDGKGNQLHPPWVPNLYTGLVLKIVGGTGVGQVRNVVSNTNDTLTVDQAWTTIPDSTSAFVVENPNPRSWYEIFADGASAGERLPVGAVPGGPTGRFTTNVPGISTQPWYKTWFFNSLNSFQRDGGLSEQLTQYDTGLPSGNGFTWSQQWPGSKLDVPLLLTELGSSRFNVTPDSQIAVVADAQAQVATNVLKASTNLMGYTVFEWNDEPNKNGNVGPADSEGMFGITSYNLDQSNFRNGTLLYNLQTGTTSWAGGTLPNLTYPVYELVQVASNKANLLARLKSIFAQLP